MLETQTDRWVAIALDACIPNASSHPVFVDDTALAIWRADTGPVRVWADRCPHRGMRLSHGFVDGDKLRCIYHGWGYDQDGACVSIPAHPDLRPPKTICAATYPAETRFGLVWTNLADNPKAALPVLEDTADWLPVRSLYSGGTPERLSEILRTFDLGSVAVDVGEQDTGYRVELQNGVALFFAVQTISASRMALHVVMSGEDAKNGIDRVQIAHRLVALRDLVETE